MKKPLYSHPCTWVFIDDHTRFLRALDATLPEHQPRKVFDKPREALDFLIWSAGSLAVSLHVDRNGHRNKY
jgi:hypothetical protein